MSELTKTRILRERPSALIAFFIGWLIYLIAWLTDGYESLSILFQPFLGAILSAVFVGLARLIAMLFRVLDWDRGWWKSPAWAFFLALACALLLGFARSLGLTVEFVDPDGFPRVGLRSDVVISGYLGLMYAITNWPLAPKEVSR